MIEKSSFNPGAVALLFDELLPNAETEIQNLVTGGKNGADAWKC